MKFNLLIIILHIYSFYYNLLIFNNVKIINYNDNENNLINFSNFIFNFFNSINRNSFLKILLKELILTCPIKIL
jgi:hypothetical protein